PFGGTGGLTKGDFGTLILSADNGTWAGTTTINAGALRVTNNGALGLASSGTTVANVVGATLQLAGVSTSEILTLNNSGINNGGALQAWSGTNLASGAITLASASTIGANSGATLTLRGGISGAFGLTFSGAGDIVVDTNPLTTPTGITNLNTGTVTLAVNSPAYVGTI